MQQKYEMSGYLNSKSTDSSFRAGFRRINLYPFSGTVMTKQSVKQKIIFTPKKVRYCVFEGVCFCFRLNEHKLIFSYLSVRYIFHSYHLYQVWQETGVYLKIMK